MKMAYTAARASWDKEPVERDKLEMCNTAADFQQLANGTADIRSSATALQDQSPTV